MKYKVAGVLLMAILSYSCKAKKETADYKPVPVKEEIVEVVAVTESKVLSPVENTPETVALASTYDGKALNERKCINCHKGYAPSDFSKEDWVPIIKRMQKKARITDAEALAIFNYMTAETK